MTRLNLKACNSDVSEFHDFCRDRQTSTPFKNELDKKPVQEMSGCAVTEVTNELVV